MKTTTDREHNMSARTRPARRGLTGITCLAALAILAACTGLQPLDETHVRTNSQSDAGSVDVTVLSVTEWNRYREKLQPAFGLSSKDALEQVLPRTLYIDQQLQEAFGASARVGLPTDVVTQTDALAADGSATTTRERVATSGEVPAAGTGATLGSQGDPRAFPYTASDLQSDPILKYQLAAALQQEVAMLDTYVRDAAIPEGYQAYVVRLQVTMMPKLRRQPYDVYTTISFLDRDANSDDRLDRFYRKSVRSDLMEQHPRAMNQSREEWEQQVESMVDTAIRTNGVPEDQDLPPTVMVVPLLVTDNIENAIRSRSLDRMRQLALGLSGTIGNVGAAANIQQRIRAVEQVLGNNYNSLFSVAGVNQSSIRVRFGANRYDVDQYMQVTRNHSVTVLMLIRSDSLGGPKPLERVLAIARSTFTDSSTGKSLNPPLAREFETRVNAVYDRYQWDPIVAIRQPRKRWADGADPLAGLTRAQRTAKSSELIRAARRATNGDYEGFVTAMQHAFPNTYDQETGRLSWGSQSLTLTSLFADLVSTDAGTLFTRTTIPLPKIVQPELPKKRSARRGSWVLVDDGKKGVVSVPNGLGLVADEIDAYITVEAGSSKVRIPAESLSVSVDGTRLVVRTPSLKTLGKIGKGNTYTLCVDVVNDPESRWTTGRRSESYPLIAIEQNAKKEPDPSPLKISTVKSVVRAKTDGSGTIRVQIAYNKDGDKDAAGNVLYERMGLRFERCDATTKASSQKPDPLKDKVDKSGLDWVIAKPNGDWLQTTKDRSGATISPPIYHNEVVDFELDNLPEKGEIVIRVVAAKKGKPLAPVGKEHEVTIVKSE